MNRINKEYERIIDKFKITKLNNIIYGTNIPMPDLVIPTPWKTYIRFDHVEAYFFFFDEKGITIYPMNENGFVTISWNEVDDFKVSHFFIIGKITIKTKGNTYKFQLNRYVFGCPWIKINTRYLEDNHYFYTKKQY